MTCYHPCKMFYTGGLTENGKDELIFTNAPGDFIPAQRVEAQVGHRIQPNEHTRIIGGRLALVDYVPVPCGKCVGCRLDYSRRWAVRCCLEASYHQFNYFVTLTYDNDHYPKDIQDCKSRLRDFHKRLRGRFGKVRLFACTETGDRSGRYHHHAIYFGLEIPDLKVHSVQDGVTYYVSESLSRTWKQGHVLIGECNFKSCAYVARYCMKKVSNKNECAITMSRKPGLGLLYFQEHFKDIYETDRIYFDFGDFKSAAPPRYFNEKLKEFDPYRVEFLAEIRKTAAQYGVTRYAESHGIAEKDVLDVQEYDKKQQIRRLKRNV